MSAPARASEAAAREQIKRRIVLDHKIIPRLCDGAAVAERGVLAHADIRNQDQLLRCRRFVEGAQGLLDDAVVVPRAGALLVLGLGQSEEEQAAEAKAGRFFGFLDCDVDRNIEDAGHGGDRAANAGSRADEERIDQVAGLKRCLANQGAQRLIAPQPAHACFRKRHGTIVLEGKMAEV
jgi:hypothetical protein